MKNLLAFIFILLISNIISAQTKDTISNWDLGGVTSFTLSQTQFKYWSAGGENSANINAIFNVKANYKKDKLSWQNNLDLGYGTQKSSNKPFRKTDDKIDFSSKFGYEAINKFFYTGLYNFKTQFTDGFEYLDNGDSNNVSTFMAPAYMLYSFGIDFLPNKEFSIYTSPLTGKSTFVLNKELSNIGAFGVDTGKIFRNEFGAYIKIEMNKKITKSLTINTKAGFFSNYLKNPQNIDVNIDLLASFKATKFITINFNAQLIYDDDILILVNQTTGKKGKRLQIKEIFGVGFTFNF